jgi:ribulose 1,5-bisphosphate synthetase/thiazole synthase
MHASNDVLAVGAGPVGLMAAGELAGAGSAAPLSRGAPRSLT